MKKIFLLAGTLLAGFLIFRIYEGQLLMGDVIKEMAVPSMEEEEVITTVKNISPDWGDPAPKQKSLTVAAFGDIMLGRYVRTLIDKYGKDYIFEKFETDKENIFKDANVVFANLEGPIKGKGYKSDTSMVFGFNEDIAPFLKNEGFNVFSITNNHALDQGWDGRDSTISTLEKNNLGWCGHPKEADKNSVYYGKTDDVSYAFICFTDVTFKLNKEKAVELIKEVRPKVDYLIISIHWGYEYEHKPSKTVQINPAHDFMDAGADFIIGHHPHVVQSFGEYNGKLIFYSLGNFIFDQYWSKDTQEELAIKFTLDKTDDGALKTKVSLMPLKSQKSQPRLMTKDEFNEWIERFIGYGNYDEKMKIEIRNGVIEVGY
ncbi:CapA family protein [Candidatus Peregrinibacteria bacterium]|nr:CapA family protein [Candidatus Peregrinibacteria bacterium]